MEPSHSQLKCAKRTHEKSLQQPRNPHVSDIVPRPTTAKYLASSSRTFQFCLDFYRLVLFQLHLCVGDIKESIVRNT